MKSAPALGPIFLSAVLVTAAPAGAQTKEEKAGARAAADAGGDAFDAGKYAEAADLFERAERLVHAPPHLLYAARAHVKLGHLVEARELYLTLTRERLAANAPRPFRDAQQAGEKELEEIEPRLAYVSIVVQGGAGASNVRVTRNGDAVPSELLGVPIPVNPGSQAYQASADNMESTVTTIKLAEGAKETVLLTLRSTEGEKPSKATPAAAGATSSASAASDSAPSDAGGGRPLLIGSIVGFGVAVAGGVVGGVFLSKSLDNSAKVDELCTPLCPQADRDTVESLDQDATTQKGIAIGGFVAGGLGLAAGVTLLVLDLNRPQYQSAARVTPLVGWNYAGVAGTF